MLSCGRPRLNPTFPISSEFGVLFPTPCPDNMTSVKMGQEFHSCHLTHERISYQCSTVGGDNLKSILCELPYTVTTPFTATTVEVVSAVRIKIYSGNAVFGLFSRL